MANNSIKTYKVKETIISLQSRQNSIPSPIANLLTSNQVCEIEKYLHTLSMPICLRLVAMTAAAALAMALMAQCSHRLIIMQRP